MAAAPSSCADCGSGPLGHRNTSGYCGRCVGRARMRDPEARARMAAGMRRRLMSDPGLMESYRQRMTAARESRCKETMRERWLREQPWHKGNEAQPKGSEPRLRAARAISERRMAWCPPELRAEYRHLVNVKRVPTAEAREIILRQHEADMQRWRRSIGAREEPGPEPEPQVPEFDNDATPIERATATAAALCGLTLEELTGPGRELRLTRPRWAVMLALSEGEELMSLSAIGRELGRDHHTVSYGLKQAAKLRDSDPVFAALCAKVAGA